MLTAHRAGEPGVPEAEDTAVGRDQPVALTPGGGGHPDDRRIEVLPTHRPVEPRVTEGEDPPVGPPQPVAPAVRRGRHADHGRAETLPTHGAGEPGRSVGEHAAIPRREHETLARGRWEHQLLDERTQARVVAL